MAHDKNQKAIKQMFRDAFERLGGTDFLVEFANESEQNKRVFVQALTKLIPLEVTGRDGMPLSIRVISLAADQAQFGSEGRTITLGPQDVEVIPPGETVQ
jgi:hypothetical protein